MTKPDSTKKKSTARYACGKSNLPCAKSTVIPCTWNNTTSNAALPRSPSRTSKCSLPVLVVSGASVGSGDVMVLTSKRSLLHRARGEELPRKVDRRRRVEGLAGKQHRGEKPPLAPYVQGNPRID